ncbi:MAG TPA: hypothetical protein ENN52_01905 [Methanofollis liminatans]|uniref:Uncharacterized protein n=1 Tax=Methanofollis liminatans TaxID=2201 RepID=A0A831PS39_9EURY|nr:hypothetical protein [Methanofollis liminatans]
MQDLLAPLLYAFTTLFVILDPLLSVPIFVSLTDIMGKVLGMLLAAIAVKIIVDGIVGLL